jgi:integrase
MALIPSSRRDKSPLVSSGGMSMKGGIYTKEHCPVCGQKFVDTGSDLICQEHLTRPGRVRIAVYNKSLHRHVYITSDPETRQPLTSYKQAERLLTVIRREIDKLRDFDATRYVTQKVQPFRFENWSEAWLEKKGIEVEKGLRSPSYLKVLWVYVSKFTAFFGQLDIRDIGTKQIHEFYLSLRGAPHYQKNILNALEKMLRDAFLWGDIGVMPHFPKIEVPEPEISTIDMDVQDAVINAIPGQMDRDFVLFTAREMIRPSETRALYWADLDLKHDRVTVRRHFSLNRIRPTTKAKQIKYLPLDAEVKAALEGLPRHLLSPFVFWKGKSGRPFSESWARKLWKTAAGSMGVTVSLYQGTRHSSASAAADRVGVDATQEFLHHTSRRITERYVKQNPDRLKKVLRKPK